MRRLAEYSFGDHLRMAPLRDALRQARNDLWLAVHKRRPLPALSRFLDQNRELVGKNIAAVVAFEEPWVLDWLLRMTGKHLLDATVLVFDNSRSAEARLQISQVCARNQTPYLALPPYPTRHANRSHGMAMSWIYHNVIRALQPRIFGFLDHDLIPYAPLCIAERMAGQPAYGLLNTGKHGYWSLWAGYCFFEAAFLANQPVNFLYDFSRGLDTGGRNWRAMYGRLDKNKLRMAADDAVAIHLPTLGKRPVQRVDGCWLHIGGISYARDRETKRAFFEELARTLDEGRPVPLEPLPRMP